MFDSVLNVVVTGAGRAGADFHVPSFNAQPGVRVAAVCDPDLERAREAAKAGGVDAAYASLEEALDRHQPDIVSVCSPPSAHLDDCRRALRAGAHVLLEKPMVVDINEFDELDRLREETGLKVVPVHNYKFSGNLPGIIERVRDGEIGSVLHLERTWFRNGTEDRMITDPDFWCHSMPGGRWAETVAHDLYIAYQFVGPLTLESVEARKRSDEWPWLVADEVRIGLRSDGSFVSLCYSAHATASLLRTMTIHGSKAALVTDGRRAAKVPLKPARAPSPISQLKGNVVRVLGGVKRRLSGAGGATGPDDPTLAPRGTGHWAVIEGFVQHVRDGAEPPASWDEAERTMRLVAEIGDGIESAAASTT